jgi:hypothetical protein
MPDEGRAARVGWYALLGVPALVPVAVGLVPFSSAAFSFNLFVYPKLFVLACVVGVSAIAWAAGALTGTIETRSMPLKWWLVAFLALAGVSTAFALSPALSFFGGRYHAVGLLAFLLAAAVAFLATQLVTGPARMRALSWSAVAGGAVVAFVGLLQVVGLDPLRALDAPGFVAARGGSLLGNPDFTGTYLVVPVVLAASLALSEVDRRPRLIAAGAFVLTAAAMVATLTRGAWIAAAVGLVLIGVALVRGGVRPARWVWGVLAAALLLPVLLILRDPLRASRQIADIFAGATGSGARLVLWRDALAVVARHPLFGTGPDAYRLGWYPIRSVVSVRLSGLASITEDPHNIVMLLLATVGIPAAAAAVGLVIASLYSGAGAALQRGAGARRLVYTGWWAASAALFVALLFSTNTASVLVALFLGIGVLSAARSRPASWPDPVRYGVGAALGLLGATAIVVYALTMSADMTVMRAQSSPDRLALLRSAASTAPWDAEAVSQADETFGRTALLELQSGAPQGRSDAAAAEQRFRETIAADPHEYKSYAALASFLDNAGAVLGPDALKRAVTAADSGLEVYPVSAEAAYLKATAQIGLGDPQGAAVTLESPVGGQPIWEVDPEYPSAGVVYAEALLRAGDRAKAAGVAATLQKRFPGDQDVQALAKRVREGTPGK